MFTYWLEDEDSMVRFRRMSNPQTAMENVCSTGQSAYTAFSHRDSLKKSVRITDKKPQNPSTEAGSFFDLIRDSDSSTSLRGKVLKRTPSLTGYRRRSHDGRANEMRSMSKEVLGANGYLPRHSKPHSPSTRKKQATSDNGNRSPKLLPSIVVNNTREDSDSVPKETDRLLDNAGQVQEADRRPPDYTDIVDGNLNDLSDHVGASVDLNCDKQQVICMDEVNANGHPQNIPRTGNPEIML